MLDGRQFGVEQHEETLTESLLLEIARSHPSVAVRTFSRKEESNESGADWAWWWEGERQWFGAIVQAKRLSSQGRGAFGYDFSYRPKKTDARPDPERQIDLLLRASRTFDLPALYVLYNGPDHVVDPRTWACREIAFDPSAMGAAVLPATVAAWLLGLDATSQDTVNAYSRPLPCEICPDRCRGYDGAVAWLLGWGYTPDDFGFDPDTPPDDPALLAAFSYLSMLANARIGQFSAFSRLGSPEVAYVRRGVREEPPAYVRATLRGDAAEDLEAREPVPQRVVVFRRAPNQ